MSRVHNWPELLPEYLSRRKEERFQWGVMDCCTFACDWVEEITGIDPMKELRETYSGTLTAQKVMRKFLVSKKSVALGDLAARIAQDCGFEEIRPLAAQRGDVALTRIGDIEALCIVGPANYVHGPGPDGIVTLPLDLASRAWRI